MHTCRAMPEQALNLPLPFVLPGLSDIDLRRQQLETLKGVRWRRTSSNTRQRLPWTTSRMPGNPGRSMGLTMALE
jgi:hypothetical protein